jgi:AraC-like DNA-binding protein
VAAVTPAVLRHESDEHGRLLRVQRAADVRLRGVVNGYCGYVHEGTGVARRREVAQDQVTIIIGFGPRLVVSGPGHAAAETDCFVAPLHPSYAITEEHDGLHGVQIDLSPLGAHMLFGIAMHELSHHLVVPLDAVLGDGVRELVERVACASAWELRFEILDDYIARRVSTARPPSPDVLWAWRRLRETGGRIEIGGLTAELGCSNRHLVSRFHEQLGPAPKTVARLVRFQRAVASLTRTRGRRFAEIAQACGYYDQAHLDRDFRELAGISPSAFTQSLLPDGIGVAA